MLSSILFSTFTPYVGEIIGYYYQSGFWCSRSTTVHMFCIH